MVDVLKRIRKEKLVQIPNFVVDDCMYQTIMGSMAYGVSTDSSDCDVYGFCMPSKHTIFPHLAGHIPGFGQGPQGFNQWQEHHIKDPSVGKEYDISIYSIIKYFQLCMENNPNMIDSLFTPQNCVLHITSIGQMVRDNRKMFLHKGCYKKLKGYAYSQLHKAKIKSPKPGSKRYEVYKKYGYDVKFCYHVVRLLDECEQILTHHDLDLQNNREQLKAIRRGEISFKDIEDIFTRKEKELGTLYNESKLRSKPDESAIKDLLMSCLEAHFGSLDKAVTNVDGAVLALRDINKIIQKHDKLL